MQKEALDLLIQSLEIAQKSGKVEPDAMIQAGIAYQQAKKLRDEMQPGDVLIVFTPEKKTDQPGVSAEQSRKEQGAGPQKKVTNKH